MRTLVNLAEKPSADQRPRFNCWCVHWQDSQAHRHEIYVPDEPTAARLLAVAVRELGRRP